MLKNISLLIFLAFCFTEAIHGQIGNWEAYPSLNRVNDIQNYQDEIWASTNGGLFSYSSGSESKIISAVDGLHRPETSSFIYNPSTDLFWLGFIDGVIQSFDPSTLAFTNYTDIQRNQRYTSKEINHIENKGDTLILSVDFGIVLWDAERGIVIDSYTNFGDIGSAIPVIGTTLVNDTLFASTNQGLIWGNINDDLVLPTNWKNYLLGTNDFTQIGLHISHDSNGLVYLSGSSQNYIFENDEVNLHPSIADVFLDFKIDDQTIIATTSSRVYSISGLNNTSVLFTKSNDVETLTSSSISNGDLFIGTINQGMIDYSLESEVQILPDGPFLNFFRDLNIDGDVLVSASSPSPGKTASDYTESGFYIFDGLNWNNINNKTNQSFQMNGGRSFYLSDISNEHYAFGSWGAGIAIYNKESGETTVYNNRNTSEITGIANAETFVVITGVSFSSNGDLWATNFLNNQSSLYQYDFSEDSWNSFPKSPLVNSGDNYFGLTLDSFGQYWIPLVSTEESGRGLFVFDIGDTETISDDKGFVLTSDSDKGFLPSNQITAVVQDKRGEIWVGTTRGLVRYLFPDRIIDGTANDRRAEYLRNTAGDSIYFRDTDVTSIAVNAANQKWIGTSNSGLWLISENGNEILKRFTTNNSPLPTNRILSIAVNDNDGKIFIATETGLMSYQDVTIKGFEEQDKLIIYPNPFIYSRHDGESIIIEGLSQTTILRVLSSSGKLIEEITAEGGRISWKPLSINGNHLASGIYFIIAVEPEGSQTGIGKLSIIK